MIKQYLLDLLRLCSDQQFGQVAIEWAILTGKIKLTYDRETDLRLIMGEPGLPKTGQYAQIIESYQSFLRANPIVHSRNFPSNVGNDQKELQVVVPRAKIRNS